MVCRDRGWHEDNRPICAGCMNPIGVRGEKDVAVLIGPVLECEWTGGVWLSHFQCRRWEWWYATPTDDPLVRVVPAGPGYGRRKYKLLTDQPGYWLNDPQVKHCKARMAQKG